MSQIQGIIHLAVFEPIAGGNRSGGFEWRKDRVEAEKEFRYFRGGEGTAYLFTDVTVGDLLPSEITKWADNIIWNKSVEEWFQYFGQPTKTYSRK